MAKKFTVAVDAMGGDNSPEKIIKGISLYIWGKISVMIFFRKKIKGISLVKLKVT